MMKSNETIIKMMAELNKMMKTMSPLMIEALEKYDEPEMMEMVTTSLRLIKLLNDYVDVFIEESEENDKRMKRIEAKLDTIIDRSGDINSVVHETRTIVRDVRGDIVILKKRKTEN